MSAERPQEEPTNTIHAADQFAAIGQHPVEPRTDALLSFEFKPRPKPTFGATATEEEMNEMDRGGAS